MARSLSITAYDIARNYLGVKEFPGAQKNNSLIMAMHHSVATWPENDETPWCSAFVNWVCFQLQPFVPMSDSLMARSWLKVGNMVPLSAAERGFDIVIFQRGTGAQPGPEVLNAPGHVAFFSSRTKDGLVEVLGGNQGNAVTLAKYRADTVLGVRRLY